MDRNALIIALNTRKESLDELLASNKYRDNYWLNNMFTRMSSMIGFILTNEDKINDEKLGEYSDVADGVFALRNDGDSWLSNYWSTLNEVGRVEATLKDMGYDKVELNVVKQAPTGEEKAESENVSTDAKVVPTPLPENFLKNSLTDLQGSLETLKTAAEDCSLSHVMNALKAEKLGFKEEIYSRVCYWNGVASDKANNAIENVQISSFDSCAKLVRNATTLTNLMRMVLDTKNEVELGQRQVRLEMLLSQMDKYYGEAAQNFKIG